MTHSIVRLTILLAALCVTLGVAQEQPKISTADFDVVIGSWQGTLTYLDYTSGKPYTMPAEVDIQRLGKTNSYVSSIRYPKEPGANSADTLTISSDGTRIDDQLVISRKKGENGEIEIITEETGKDGNDQKPATFRHTHLLSKTKYVKRKSVQFVGEKEWITRHEYSFVSKPGK